MKSIAPPILIGRFFAMIATLTMRMVAVGIVFSLALTGTATAQEYYWNVANGDWFTGSNWNLFDPPTPGNPAYIDNSGTANVEASGAVAGALFVGSSGSGTLNVLNGGNVQNSAGYIATYAGSTGMVTVNGTNSSWTTDTRLYVGNEGSGTLNILNGGQVQNASGNVGNGIDSTGLVTVDGTGSI